MFYFVIVLFWFVSGFCFHTLKKHCFPAFLVFLSHVGSKVVYFNDFCFWSYLILFVLFVSSLNNELLYCFMSVLSASFFCNTTTCFLFAFCGIVCFCFVFNYVFFIPLTPKRRKNDTAKTKNKNAEKMGQKSVSTLVFTNNV